MKDEAQVLTPETETQVKETEETTQPETETQVDAPTEVIEKTDVELLAELKQRRATGIFTLQGFSIEKMKRVRNFLNGKAKFKGTQQAYYLVVGKFMVDQALNIDPKDSTKPDAERSFDFPASTIEILDFFMRQYEGTGFNSAQEFFELAMPINNVLGAIQDLDKTIKALEEKISKETKIETESPSA